MVDSVLKRRFKDRIREQLLDRFTPQEAEQLLKEIQEELKEFA